jgi:hypothetical protein
LTDPERPGVTAILDAWQSAAGGAEPVVMRFAFGTELGGALEAVAGYPAGDRWTLVTLGLTELGEKATRFPDISGYGFEFTMRLPRAQSTTLPPEWPRRVLNALAERMRAGADFGPGDWVVTGGPLAGEAANAPLTSLAIAYDPQVARIATPNGSVDFLTVVGLTTAEGEAAQQAGAVQPIVDEIRARDPLLTTDPSRPSVR